MKIKYTGKESDVLKILSELKGRAKAIRVTGREIVIQGKAFYVGDEITIENGEVVEDI
jgi:hypothetical protein